MNHILALLLATSMAACATPATGAFDPDFIRATIPISDFDGYDPYPPGAAGQIHAYVNFAPDGILRASLGCAKIGAPFTFGDDDTLILKTEEGLSKPDYSDTTCSQDLIRKEKALAQFLAARPTISAWTVNGVYLKTRRQTLLLQSVADVLDEGTQMKVDS